MQRRCTRALPAQRWAPGGETLELARGTAQVCTAWIGVLCTWVLAVVLSFVLFCALSAVVVLFTTDPNVRALGEKLLVLLCFGVLVDANQVVCGGVIRAAALQKYDAIVNILGYYGVGVPLCYCAFVWCKVACNRSVDRNGDWTNCRCGFICCSTSAARLERTSEVGAEYITS